MPEPFFPFLPSPHPYLPSLALLLGKEIVLLFSKPGYLTWTGLTARLRRQAAGALAAAGGELLLRNRASRILLIYYRFPSLKKKKL